MERTLPFFTISSICFHVSRSGQSRTTSRWPFERVGMKWWLPFGFKWTGQ